MAEADGARPGAGADAATEPGTSSSESATRLDAELVNRGLARSRSVAARLIDEGLVSVNGRPVTKSSAKVDATSVIEVAPTDSWVSRGAHKLLAALDAFEVDPAGRLALDAGASTGGFTQVLLERGATKVIAVDVGHGQLAPEIAIDARVASFEGVNVRDLDARYLASLTGSSELPSLVVADLSFISLTHVIDALIACSTPDADLLLLIKPQFEVGRSKEGIVKNSGIRAEAISGVLWAAWDAGLGTLGLVPSPIAGGAGNREYLVHLRRRSETDPPEWASPSNWEARLPSIAGA